MRRLQDLCLYVTMPVHYFKPLKYTMHRIHRKAPSVFPFEDEQRNYFDLYQYRPEGAEFPTETRSDPPIHDLAELEAFAKAVQKSLIDADCYQFDPHKVEIKSLLVEGADVVYCLTFAPRDYDYNYVAELSTGLEIENYNKKARLIAITDPKRADYQIGRYFSGLGGGYKISRDAAEAILNGRQLLNAPGSESAFVLKR